MIYLGMLIIFCLGIYIGIKWANWATMRLIKQYFPLSPEKKPLERGGGGPKVSLFFI